MIQIDTVTRNAMLAALIDRIAAEGELRFYSGAIPATNATAASGTLLATIDLPATPFATPADGAAAMAGTWEGVGAAAAATGTEAGYFRIYNGATAIYQGTVTAPGGGGDMTLVNTSIAENQPVSVSTFTLTDGNGPA